MSDATGVAEAMLGLPGFRVLEVTESDAEVVIRIETMAELVGCGQCGVVAVAQDRMAVEYRDLAAFGRPARLVWVKRRWRCEEPLCAARTCDRTPFVGPLAMRVAVLVSLLGSSWRRRPGSTSPGCCAV